MEPVKFRAYLEAELGKRAAELVTVAPGNDKGGRPSKGETGDTVSPVNSDADDKKAKRLRAFLRAPDLIQDLYRDGLVSQTVAAPVRLTRACPCACCSFSTTWRPSALSRGPSP
ncbi:hypothetical protein FTUN_7926 [Frigoriglobus tundricola]|uniref:Uncharacterized protein n=1 Tax=Frigoriglobus tundricola TaxID=2774151 RepID=A0A6M5Z461_9BACT|nr:hypothetical protein FTUN_7926 [Frigoriglobus tundricola]